MCKPKCHCCRHIRERACHQALIPHHNDSPLSGGSTLQAGQPCCMATTSTESAAHHNAAPQIQSKSMLVLDANVVAADLDVFALTPALLSSTFRLLSTSRLRVATWSLLRSGQHGRQGWRLEQWCKLWAAGID